MSNDESLLTSVVPRTLETKNKILGFELSDVLILFLNLSIQNLIFGGTSLKVPLVFGTSIGIALLLFVFKRGKPDLFLQHYFQHLLLPIHLFGNAPDASTGNSSRRWKMNSHFANNCHIGSSESEPIPHMILWDGSLSTAIELLPLDIECFDEGRVNQLTEQLRAFVNSLTEGLTAQFLVKVESDFADLIERHQSLITTESSFLRSLDETRCQKLDEESTSEAVFRPRLFLLLKRNRPLSPPRSHLEVFKDSLGGLKKRFDDLAETLSQSLENAKSTLSSMGFLARKLNQTGIDCLGVPAC